MSIIQKRCSFCGKTQTCFTIVMGGGLGPSICIACAADALLQLGERYHDRLNQESFKRGLADRKAGRMYPLSEVMREYDDS